MKKMIIAAIALMAMCFNVNAQTQEDIDASKARVDKLSALLKKKPKASGLNEIDGFTNDLVTTAEVVVANSVKLQTFTTAVNDVAAGKEGAQLPSLDDVDALYKSIQAQLQTVELVKNGLTGTTTALSTFQQKVAAESNVIQKAKIAKQAANAVKVVDFSKSVLPLVVEEVTAQSKMVQSVVSAVKK